MLDIKLVRKTKGAGLQGIIDRLPKAVETGVQNALDQTQKSAIQNLSQMGVHPNDVSPAQVKTELTFVGGNAMGRVWVDSDRSLFVEFGTGIHAEMPHVGKTKTFHESNFAYWLLPKEKADRDYGADRLELINGNWFYWMSSQQPHPFMRTAAFENRDKNVQAVLDSLREMIKDVVK